MDAINQQIKRGFVDGSGAVVVSVSYDAEKRMTVVERRDAPPVGIPSGSLEDGWQTFQGYTGG